MTDLLKTPTLEYAAGPDQEVTILRRPPAGRPRRLTVRVRTARSRRAVAWTTAGYLLTAFATVFGTTYLYLFFTVGLAENAGCLAYTAFFAAAATVACFFAAGRRMRGPVAELRFTPHMVDAAKAEWQPAADARSDFPPNDPAGWHIPAAALRRIEVVPPSRPGDSAGCTLRVVGTNGTASLNVPMPEPALQALAAEARRVVGLEQRATDDLSDQPRHDVP